MSIHAGCSQYSVLPWKAEQTATSRNGTGMGRHRATRPLNQQFCPQGTASPWEGATMLGTTSSS